MLVSTDHFVAWRRSWSSNHFLRHNPPPYPHSVPSARITRGHGMIMQIMFVPFARPTALRAFSSPRRFAIQEYERVSPTGIDCKIFQARSWNGEPTGASGILNLRFLPEKKSANCDR